MDNYQLSKTAAADLDRLYLKGLTDFGLQQADDYFDELIERFNLVFEHPDWGADYTHIALNLYRYEHKAHSFYYQPKADHVLIVRVLGKKQDPAYHI